MKFSGYWVSVEHDNLTLERTTFDETDLDPATNWKQAWQNQDTTNSTKGFIDLADALNYAAHALTLASGNLLSPFDVGQASKFEPVWINNRCEIHSLSQMLGAK